MEENHFGIRKRLLEYDDVMNQQRKVIYEKRRHALMGERIGMDIANVFWDRVVNIINNNSGDYKGCEEMFIKTFFIECPFSEEELATMHREALDEKAYAAVMGAFKARMDKLQEVTWSVIKDVYEQQGQIYQRVNVPMTDGRGFMNIPCDLKEAYDTECKSVVKQFEKVVMLHIIDDCWKENLRLLDELKHSVQNSASYEQKDPLVIFKIESAKLFDTMIDEMNNRMTEILSRGQLYQPEQPPQQEEAQAQRPAQQRRLTEAAPEKHSQRFKESKGDEMVDQGQKAAASHDTRATAAQRPQPIRKDKLPGRNDPCPCGSGKKFKNCHGRGLV